MVQDVEEQVALTAEVVERNLGFGDQVHEPRPIDHLAGFRTRTAAEAAADEQASRGGQ